MESKKYFCKCIIALVIVGVGALAFLICGHGMWATVWAIGGLLYIGNRHCSRCRWCLSWRTYVTRWRNYDQHWQGHGTYYMTRTCMCKDCHNVDYLDTWEFFPF